LSEHSTSMEPKFSIEARRFTITWALTIRAAPRARLTLMMVGRSCGVNPTARARENSTESSRWRWKNRLKAKMARIITRVSSMRK